MGMTEQEAIDIIKQVPLYRYECELEEHRQSELFGALVKGIKAIEKQIAKKSIDKLMHFECPSCGEVEIMDCGYCPVCGQKLLW